MARILIPGFRCEVPVTSGSRLASPPGSHASAHDVNRSIMTCLARHRRRTDSLYLMPRLP